MNFYIVILFALSWVICNGQNTRPSQSHYAGNVGDIAFDKKMDDANFRVCNENKALQYYNLPNGFPFEGEKVRLIEIFEGAFRNKRFENKSGYITIRFIVNCEGSTGRFRIQEMDSKYQPTTFDKNLVNQLLQTTRSLRGWQTANNGIENVDYYQYLTFKIAKGELTEILP